MTEFDKRKCYEEECEPLVQELLQKCQKNSLPFFISFCVRNDEEDSSFISDGLFPGALGIELTDDKLSRYVLVGRGFGIKQEGAEVELDWVGEEYSDNEAITEVKQEESGKEMESIYLF